MKHFSLRLLPVAFVSLAAMMSASCDDDDSTTSLADYQEWRKVNTDFFEEQKYAMTPEGEMLYNTLTPSWNSGATLLIKYLNDRSKTEGNLSPMLTSRVSVKYIGRLYDGTPFDSSYTNTDSLFYTNLTDVISGWTIALQYMRVGDSVRVVIPYTLGYGTQVTAAIPPYSTLLFDIKLTDIVDYEIKP